MNYFLSEILPIIIFIVFELLILSMVISDEKKRLKKHEDNFAMLLEKYNDDLLRKLNNRTFK